MSINQETNRVPAFVSFRGRAMPSGKASVAVNVMASNLLASNATAPDMILSAALSGTRASCESHRDFYPPSSPPDTR